VSAAILLSYFFSGVYYYVCGRAERQAETRRENSGKKQIKINRKTEQKQERKKK
jgi:hypothetical protein